ncbi:MAG: hypothetical protein LBG88_02315 [Christensenellaceae bacterium]|jgi:hypothetical protein|nr:hypothetical protein [Christensenellaceae bacterium]
MNAKTTRKYELITKIAGNDTNTAYYLSELCDIDFATAFEMWEYALSLGKDIVVPGFDIFEKASEMKMRQLFCESIPLQKLIYSSKSARAPQAMNFLCNLILSAKLDAAHECLAKLLTNGHMDFGNSMKLVLDTLFAMYCKKNNVKVPVFTKKQKELLVGFIEKVKGPNKALLLQRMKEL